jgi:hypothetical protein
MDDEQSKRLTDAEAMAFFDRLFPHGFAGADVLAEIAPEGWEKSPLLACFHPSPEQLFRERLQMYRNIQSLGRSRRERESEHPEYAPGPEPTLEEVRAEWKETAFNTVEELTELVGQCLWDVFSDNHEVMAADGRIVDIGSFRGSSAFLDGYLSRESEPWNEDYMRFYMGTLWTSGRADLSPLYGMIFGRLKVLGADWEYHFPALGVVDLSPLKEMLKEPEDYSPSEAFAKEQEEKDRQMELERTRGELAEIEEQARHEALDRLPPSTVRAYQIVYGRDPNGWPPA